MRGIIKYFLDNPISGNMLMFFILGIGCFMLTQLKSTILPEFDARLITIQVVYPGSSPQEIEEGIVSKIEENIKGLDGIERSSSTSSENAAFVRIEVKKGFDTNFVLRDVKNAVDQINSFPAGMERPVIRKIEYEGFAIDFSISGDVDLRTLKNKSQEVERELMAIDGISKLNIEGFPDEEIEISFREDDLRKYNLTFDEVLSTIRANNLEVTGGKIKSAQEELLIRAKNKKMIGADLRNIIIKTNPGGGNVKLHQAATIRDHWEDVPSRSFVNGNPAVIITVKNTIREDVLDITESIRNYIIKFNDRNADIKATIIEDGSEILNDRINILRDNGIIGFFLVVLILALFLNWRLAFWVGLAIPVSLAGMLMVANFLGVTINLMSLFGMIVVIGILVDDGIVIAENIYQKYEEGLPAMDSALEGTIEVFPAVFSAILTTVIGFSAFFFIDGTMGQFGIELSIVVILSLFFSLVEGALILPAHVAHSKALKNGTRQPNIVLRQFNRVMEFLREKTYRPVLNFAINYPFPMIAICISTMMIAVGCFNTGIIRKTFFPNIPSERFFVDIELPSGTPVAETKKIAARIEAETWKLNEQYSDKYFDGKQQLITNVIRNIRSAGNKAQLTICLMPTEERGELTAIDISGFLRDQVGSIPETEVLKYWSSAAFGKPVDISVKGNGKETELAVEELLQGLKEMPELRDVLSNNAEGLREINLELTPKAHNLGFTIGAVIQQVRQGFFGGEVQRLQRGEDEIKVWVRYELSDRSALSDLARMNIRSANNLVLPLSELATFSIDRGVTALYHLDGQREVRVGAEMANSRVLLSGVFEHIEEKISPKILQKYPTVTFNFNGQSREQDKTMGSMKVASAIGFLLIFFIITLTFKSISQALIVFTIIPFGFVGVGLGHYLMDIPVSVVSMLGFVALTGILVNDALVFITTFNEKIKAGNSFHTALFDTGISRFRPIVLTSVTTIVGLAPILLEKSLGARLLIPMAISVAFGLLIVTVIILAMVPALLKVSNQIKVLAMSFWEGEPVSMLEVEPSFAQRKSNIFINTIAAVFVLAALFGMIYLIWILVNLIL